MTKIKRFVKDEIVLIISFVLACVSTFFVHPDSQYVGYIDFRTLGLLLSLMAIISAFNRQGVFSLLAVKLLDKVKSTRALCMVFCLLCFFLSMLITNDVALITFVPFTILTLELSDNKRLLIPLVTLETISANLGSMLTPVGNPQNLYLFSNFDMSIGDFFGAIAPYALLSLVMIVASVMFIKKSPLSPQARDLSSTKPNKALCVVYGVLFVLAMLTVFKLVNYLVLLAVTAVVMFACDKKVLLKVDYSLLLTFVFLFVFIGNLGRVDVVNDFLNSIIVGNEVIVGVMSSQVFSNVPAAILLSGFSSNASDLLVGVNLGGLGTLIASMASLISFKYVVKSGVKSSKYLGVFTLLNILFLFVNLILWWIIR